MYFTTIAEKIKKYFNVLAYVPFAIFIFSFYPPGINKSFELIYLSHVHQANFEKVDSVIVDSDYSLKQALEGVPIPAYIKDNLVIVDVNYYSFDNKLHRGQVIVSKDLSGNIKEIFNKIEEAHFPVGKVIPIIKYSWSDMLSMEDNNTTAFNYRNVKSTKLTSAHSLGRAIDINPVLNPQIKHGIVLPPGVVYDPSKPGTLTMNSIVVKAFIKRGWQWGGRWQSTKDYQHFEKAKK
jgi:hypothetical protein